MKLLVAARTQEPLAAWIATATWYQSVRRWLKATGKEPAGVVAALDALRDSLEAEGAALTEVYAKGTTAAQKTVAALLPLAWADIQSKSGEEMPGLGKLGQGWWALAKPVVEWVVKYLGLPALGIWGLSKTRIPVASDIARGIIAIFETDAQRAQRLQDTQGENAKAKAEDIAACAGDAQCIAGVKWAWGMITEDEETDCGLLDTPLGTSIGGIFGMLGGYVTGESVLKRVE